ncbi:MAG: SEC-C domain-containing protein, partial [Oscillospiraceae bacterium]|nr:SEC-C domain-containing protein [Oscillospiraceae bacterium]
NEGLHQAIEAKEGVKVQRESRTLATITFQTYFRMYGKLSGMTGTASTEADEFRQIYQLDVVEIPTNKPVVREDHPDTVFKTEMGKYRAVIEQVQQCHAKGQPVLVGTVSVEKSELLSAMLKRRGIPHQVLNAKYHEKEATIVAQAGKLGAVTIATNMAGRGTDIMLGGNAEFMAKAQMEAEGFEEEMIEEATGFAETDDQNILAARERFRQLNDQYKQAIAGESEAVKAAGGLFIIGTERHESRRIDNQLRGRAGRQGDPGESRFYIALEDDLMRLFGGERLQGMMDSLGVDEDMPIENKMLSGQIETAQRRLEGRNFETRKNVLQFDDVMNKQREIIYGQREQVLRGDDVAESVKNMVRTSIDGRVEHFLAGDEDPTAWNFEGLRQYYMNWLATKQDFRYSEEELATLTREEVANLLKGRAEALYQKREEAFGSEIMRELERVVLLRSVDLHWMDHIDAMHELKRGIYLRSYAQHDPVVEYRHEGFAMFDEMIAQIREETARAILTVQVRLQEGQPQREQVAKPDENTGGDGSLTKKPMRAGTKVGRNDPCPCGSGKKYKKCCGR